MATTPIRERPVDDLLATGKLGVHDRVRWEDKNRAHYVTGRASVSAPRGYSMEIRITVNRTSNKISIVLLLNKRYRIRGLDIRGAHKNRHTDRNQWKWQTHKHKWTDRCWDRWAYTPEINDSEDLQAIFEEFCAECGIQCNATLDSLPSVQGTFFDGM